MRFESWEEAAAGKDAVAETECLSTRLGITTSNILDAADRLRSQTRKGTVGSAITLRSLGYDAAGRVIREINALGAVTSWSYVVTNSQSVTVVTNADGGTRIETRFRDGNLASVTGTAAYPVRYAYGVTRSETQTGIKICTAESQNYGGVEHQWIEIGDWSAGFTSDNPNQTLTGIYIGVGKVHIPDPYSKTRPDKKCTDVLASPCNIDLSVLRKKVQEQAEHDNSKEAMPYCAGFADCRHWSGYLVYGLIIQLGEKGGCGL